MLGRYFFHGGSLEVAASVDCVDGAAAPMGGGGACLKKVACNSIGWSFNKVRKRCNSNDLISGFERVVGELHAKLGVGSGMWEVRAGCEGWGRGTGSQ